MNAQRRELTGALLVDKPCGPTSHDVVAFVRRTLATSRVGHTGTLDPLATGLLVLLVGRATRLAQFLVTDEKEYIADVRLGQSTPTYDAQSLGHEAGGWRFEAGQPTRDAEGVRLETGPSASSNLPTVEEIERVLDRFRGTFLQTPPSFSAKKVGGVRSYEKARRNEPVELAPVEVTVRELQLLPPFDPQPNLQPPTSLLRLRVVCSAGFYVRSLAHDIGQALGCGAHLEGLRRTGAGRFRVEASATLDTLAAEGPEAGRRLIPLDVLLADFPAVTLSQEGLRRAGNGNSLAPEHLTCAPPPNGSSARVRLLDAEGQVLAVAETRTDGLLHPLVVLR